MIKIIFGCYFKANIHTSLLVKASFPKCQVSALNFAFCFLRCTLICRNVLFIARELSTFFPLIMQFTNKWERMSESQRNNVNLMSQHHVEPRVYSRRVCVCVFYIGYCVTSSTEF